MSNHSFCGGIAFVAIADNASISLCALMLVFISCDCLATLSIMVFCGPEGEGPFACCVPVGADSCVSDFPTYTD